MKKSLSVFALGVIVTVFAASELTAEIVIKEQARIRTSAYSFTKNENGDKSAKLWNLKNSSAADYLDFYASNEYAEFQSNP